jgi:hypothetical protein
MEDETVATPEAVGTVPEAPEVYLKVESAKELIKRVSCKIINEWDGELATHVKTDTKLLSAYTDFTEMSYLNSAMKDTNPVVLDQNGTDINIPFTINGSLKPKELVASLKERVGNVELTQMIVDESKGTHMEQFYTEYEEQVQVIEAAIKHSVGIVKKAFKVWAELLSQHYEANYNLAVSMSDVNNELRIMGLWSLDANKNLDQEFYINPEYFADEINKSCKSMSTLSKKAEETTERLTSIKGEAVHAQIAMHIKGSIDQMPTMISSTTDLIKTCKGYKLTTGEVKAIKKLEMPEGIDEDTTEGVEEI